MVIDVSLFSGVERQFYGFLGIFLVQDDMVVYLYDHLLVVAQQLRNLFDGNGGYLVAQVRAVVVTKDVCGQIRGLHLLPDAGPELDIGAFGHDILPSSTERPGAVQAAAVLLEERKHVGRYRYSVDAVLALRGLDIGRILIKCKGFIYLTSVFRMEEMGTDLRMSIWTSMMRRYIAFVFSSTSCL